MDALLNSEDVLPKLTAENEHLQRSVSELTRRLEESERQVKQERVTRIALEDSRDVAVKEVETTWKAVMEEKRDNWAAKERSQEEKIENQERLLNELKANYEVSQRLEHTGVGENESSQVSSASVAELEMVSTDLERTTQRLAEMEARNEQLRLELAQISSDSHKKGNFEEDPAISRLRSENAMLLRKLDAIKFQKDSGTRKTEGRIHALERDTEMLQRDKDSLRERVHAFRDYEDIKRELEIFRSIEVAALDDDDTTEISNPLEDAPASGNNNRVLKKGNDGSLEQLLLSRNKKLGNEMAVLRVSHQDLQQRLESLQETMRSTEAELERSQNLNATLETDLVKVQQEASNALPSSAMSTTGTYTSRYPTSKYPASLFAGRRGKASPTSSIISGFDPTSSSRNTLEAIRAGEAVGGGSGILPMVQAQRDRFKQKNSQLEAELSKQHGTVSSLRQEIASLQKDNLNLYEKSRYVSTYNRGQPSSSASAYSQHPQSTSIQISSDAPSGLSLDRYKSAYEANISPFAAFRGRESARAYKRMRLPERIVFSITRMVLANRSSRNLFAAYCFALHVLIFIMLYWMQTTDVEKHASNLGQAAGLAMARVDAGKAQAHHGGWHQEGFQAD